jgi:asparagine synthase (glutamine-hydrolysing)
MCGIAGNAGLHAISEQALRLAEAQRDIVTHRGPNDAGSWVSPCHRVLLLHRRLAVIDLELTGHQPMMDESGSMCVVFNGEIYNHAELRAELNKQGHRFRGTSDTESLVEGLRRWGTDCLERLSGMFAFACFDAKSNKLILARDRAGEKPLYYYAAEQRLHFASELKSLLLDPCLPRAIDPEALDHYLAYGFTPPDRALLSGFRKLPAGSFLTYDLNSGELRTGRYWRLPRTHANGGSPDELSNQLDQLLDSAVRQQLVADVPVGILLSGGVDSSLVVAMAARVSSAPVRTFTVSFPGHMQYDEAAYARRVAAHFGAHHMELEGAAASVALLPMLARQYDDPIGDSSMVPTFLVSRLIREHATVALGGDGGDELFGGYRHHRWLLWQAIVRRYAPQPLRGAVGWAAHRLPIGVRGRNYMIGASLPIIRMLAHHNLLFDARTRSWLVGAALRHRIQHILRAEERRASLAPAGESVLRQSTAVDFQSYLADNILVKVDRASMLTSLEVRAPFLDRHLVEFAFSRVPDHLRTTWKDRKVLLKHLARRLLPPGHDLDRKQGFSIPLSAWFAGDWGAYMVDVLRSAPPELFAPAAVDFLIEGQRRGRHNVQRLFALTMLELWRREYNVMVN